MTKNELKPINDVVENFKSLTEAQRINIFPMLISIKERVENFITCMEDTYRNDGLKIVGDEFTLSIIPQKNEEIISTTTNVIDWVKYVDIAKQRGIKLPKRKVLQLLDKKGNILYETESVGLNDVYLSMKESDDLTNETKSELFFDVMYDVQKPTTIIQKKAGKKAYLRITKNASK